ncbi:MAG: glycerol-3-phosphate acyltransferase [Chloroflexi bacterium]|nr:glycerol-3-phosphate acyltransferase [Chloroflexota bacterium]
MLTWASLAIAAYLLGSIPFSYLAGKAFRGIDIRQRGTRQVGAGNLWRMTSFRIALPVGIIDLSKGMVMAWVASEMGLGPSQQLSVGLAAVAGHNWPVFLGFHGGRGLGTSLGIILILPIINEISYLSFLVFTVINLAGIALLRSTPLPALVGSASLPVTSWLTGDPASLSLGYLALLLVLVIKRLAAGTPDPESPGGGRLLLNRLLFDRDIPDRKKWMYRPPAPARDPGKGDS